MSSCARSVLLRGAYRTMKGISKKIWRRIRKDMEKERTRAGVNRRVGATYAERSGARAADWQHEKWRLNGRGQSTEQLKAQASTNATGTEPPYRLDAFLASYRGARRTRSELIEEEWRSFQETPHRHERVQGRGDRWGESGCRMVVTRNTGNIILARALHAWCWGTASVSTMEPTNGHGECPVCTGARNRSLPGFARLVSTWPGMEYEVVTILVSPAVGRPEMGARREDASFIEKCQYPLLPR